MSEFDYDINIDDEDVWEVYFELPTENEVEPANGLTQEVIDKSSFEMFLDK